MSQVDRGQTTKVEAHEPQGQTETSPDGWPSRQRSPSPQLPHLLVSFLLCLHKANRQDHSDSIRLFSPLV